jgi:hypothetical protein
MSPNFTNSFIAVKFQLYVIYLKPVHIYDIWEYKCNAH